jgi:hypothetical protein
MDLYEFINGREFVEKWERLNQTNIFDSDRYETGGAGSSFVSGFSEDCDSDESDNVLRVKNHSVIYSEGDDEEK